MDTKRNLLYLNTISMLMIFMVQFGLSQRQASTWYFGNMAGIRFESDTAIALTSSVISTPEGCATMSDCDGNLLFYTDGITIWNKEHMIMQNGEDLLGHPSSTQSGIIIKQPGNNHRYYVFTITHEAASDGLNYSVVDMSMAGGLGAVTNEKNVPIMTPSCEKIAATFHANGTDIWVYAAEFTSNAINAYLLRETGLILTPAQSYVGPEIDNSQGAIGYLKISPSGSQMAYAQFGSNRVHLFDIDRNTGLLNARATINNPVVSGPYGVEFSWNEDLLYVSYIYTGVVQYDISLSSSEAISNSAIPLINKMDVGALQLAPDGKIYAAASGGVLDVIENPDEPGLNCDYTPSSFNLAGASARLGLPTFFASIFSFADFTTSGSCYLDTTQFTSSLRNVDSVQWCFGDTASYSNNYSAMNNPSHVFTDTGVYEIMLISYSGCSIDTINKSIRIWPMPLSNFTADTIISCEEVLSLNAGGDVAHDFLWSDGTMEPAIQVSQSGLFHVTITNENGCSNSDSIYVHFPEEELNLGPAIQRCADDTISLAVPEGFQVIKWNTGATSQHIDGLLNGNYSVLAEDQFGCIHTDTISISSAPTPSVDFGSDTLLCNEEAILIGPTSTPELSYIWSTGETTSQIWITTSGEYKVTITNSLGCASYDSISINSFQNLNLDLGSDTSLCVGVPYILDLGLHDANYIWNGELSEQRLSITEPGLYIGEIRNACGRSVDSINVEFTDCDCNVYLPTSFSPNGDGVNELFSGFSDCEFLFFELKIFNRWGGLVFSSKDPTVGWKGHVKNKNYDNGVYVYSLTYQFENQSLHRKKGSIHILR